MERMLLEYLVNSLWQAPLLALGAWLMLRAGRPGPRMQHGVWVAALLLMVALPVLSLRGADIRDVTPPVAVPLPPPDFAGAEIQAAVQIGTQARQSVGEPGSQSAFVDRPGSQVTPQISAAQASGSSGIAGWLRIRELRLSALATHRVVELYLAVIAFAMLRLLWSWMVARRMVAEATPAILTAAESVLFEACCERLQVRPPRVLVSVRTSSPLVVGVLRPALLLPEGFVGDAENYGRELEAVWWHELAHMSRRDYLANLGCRVLALPVAYHPATYAVERRVRQTREMVCDRVAAEEMYSPVGYARCLLGLAQRMQHGNAMREQTQGAGLFDGGVLEERVVELIGTKRAVSVRMRAVRLAGSMAVLLAVMGTMAIFHVRPTMAQAVLPAAADGGMLSVVVAPTALGRPEVVAELKAPSPMAIPPVTRPGGGFEPQTAQASGRAQILLFDGLNTTHADQARMRQSVMKYLDETMIPGTRVAVFGLSDKLQRVQDFTSDTATLRAAVSRTLAGFDQPQVAAADDDLRQQITLDQLGQVAGYVSGNEGSKQLLFFTTGLSIHRTSASTNFRKTTDLLAAARIAVYAVDVRGLMKLPLVDPGARPAPGPPTIIGRDSSGDPIYIGGRVPRVTMETKPASVKLRLVSSADAQADFAAAWPDLVLKVGDQVLIRVVGLDAIPRQPIRIDADGSVDLPMVGKVQAGGKTPEQVKADLVARLNRYILIPKVSVNLADARGNPVSLGPGPVGLVKGVLEAEIRPEYPASALAARVSGLVVLDGIVTKKGSITGLKVVSGPQMLRESALGAVKQWKWRPYLMDGFPIDQETRIGIQFVMAGVTPSAAAADSAGIDDQLVVYAAVPPQVAPVAEVLCPLQVMGNQKIPAEAVLARLSSRGGEEYNSATVVRDLKSLSSSGYFEEVRIERAYSPKCVQLVVHVQEKQVPGGQAQRLRVQVGGQASEAAAKATYEPGFEILSNTEGREEFMDYFAHLEQDIRRNWEPLIPVEVRAPLLKKGVVGIRFTIMADGTVATPMVLENRSGDAALDKAAWEAITSEGKFPPLPKEFTGPKLELRMGFFYNTPVPNGREGGEPRPATALGTSVPARGRTGMVATSYAGGSAPAQTTDAAQPQVAPGGLILVPAGTMARNVVLRPDPVYPPIAKAAHVQGAVVLDAVISKDGAVKDLRVVDGPEMLQGSALKAVRQWTYRPYLLNGVAVEVETTIRVNFTFGDGGPYPVARYDPAPAATGMEPAPAATEVELSNGRVRVPSGTILQNLISRPDPVYPADAKAARVQGAVVLKAVISKTGTVEDLQVVSGPEMLQTSATDAVRRWTYKPYLLNGAAVEVETTITVNFTFGL